MAWELNRQLLRPLHSLFIVGILLGSCGTILPDATSSVDVIGSQTAGNSEAAPLQFDPFRDAVNTAMAAAEMTQKAQTEADWQAVAIQWKHAIELMQAVPPSHPRYETAQQRATETYPQNFAYAQTKAGDQAIPERSLEDGVLTQVDFGEGWPFVVDGEVRCEEVVAGDYTVPLVTLHSGGQVFAVNSPAQARAEELNWHDMTEIWRDQPDSGEKAPVNWVTMRGEALCQE
ncbi:MAG: hypothetical protein VKK04_13955 [Synechococcales bacterium]|nr:hypothetical protein [Synechococcales bacterium]